MVNDKVLSNDNLLKLAKIMICDVNKDPDALDKFVKIISKMDPWDISKLLFFGTTEQNPSNSESTDS